MAISETLAFVEVSCPELSTCGLLEQGADITTTAGADSSRPSSTRSGAALLVLYSHRSLKIN